MAVRSKTSTDELAVYVTSSDYSAWSPDPTPEHEPTDDWISFDGGTTSGAIV